jgi:hypothetical protein
MKKNLLMILILISIQSFAQEIRTKVQDNPFVKNKYSNDMIINSNAALDQRNVKLSVAFNGWLYAAYSTVDSALNQGGITIMTSRDKGAKWTMVDSYTPANNRYPAFDIVVAGTDTNNLTLFLAGVDYNTNTSQYTIFVDRYNATGLNFIGSNYSYSSGSRQVYDISMATDYRFPAVGASPYSVAFIYSDYSSSLDSINYVASIDGGATWSVRQNVAVTGSYFRKVSLAYGRSASASNGRYFAAWEKLGSSGARTGKIYTSRSISTVIDPWLTPKNLDSLSSTMIDLCRNPSIAVQYNNVDNDSGSCTAVVLVERDYIGDGSDYDLLGFYNKRAHFTNIWFRLDIVNNGENDLTPDISYDPGYNNFLAVYFDSTNKKLPYIVNGMNLITPNTWNTISSQYNDNANLRAPHPRVEINQVENKVAHVWIAEGTGNKGIAMYDAEYSVLNVQEISQNIEDVSVYPNPVKDNFSISFSSKTSDNIVIRVLDITGKIVYIQNSKVLNGDNLIHVNAEALESGIYIVNIQGVKSGTNVRICVQ